MILDEILRRAEKRVERLPATFPDPPDRPRASLADAIRGRNDGTAVIAEIKCASPSRGVIRRNVDMQMMARSLVAGGCTALSVLTEPHYFGGSVRDVTRVAKAVSVPVLRKDFVIDTRQLDETYALGADAVLLIAAVLGEELPGYVDYAIDAGLEPLVEVRTKTEVESALSTRAAAIGINNRDLTTLIIDRSTTRLLSEKIRSSGRLVISESGMRSTDDVRELKPYCDAFLIGSSIMSDENPQKKLKEFVCA
ncbi:MAG: Indole-3-glycerol phosphate synthase [Methanoregula sp. PtaU1.Bin051]|nr:MAG: Indole-3-glycerol phosphate synthase [Methanoregula sp. PtaU1.Bin051]